MFHGSPVDPSTRSDERSCAATGSSPWRISARITVGAIPSTDDPMPLDDRPEPIRSGMVRDAVEEHERGADAQRAADGPRTHHPADVGEPEQAVLLADVEAVRHVLHRLDGKPAMDVHGALGPAGRPARVDDHERRIGIGIGDGRRLRSTRPASPRTCTSRPGRIGSARVTELRHHQDVLERRQLFRSLVGDRLHDRRCGRVV